MLYQLSYSRRSKKSITLYPWHVHSQGLFSLGGPSVLPERRGSYGLMATRCTAAPSPECGSRRARSVSPDEGVAEG